MYTIITDNTGRTMQDGLDRLSKHYSIFHPNKEIVIMYKKGNYHVLADGKLIESLTIKSVTKLFNPNV